MSGASFTPALSVLHRLSAEVAAAETPDEVTRALVDALDRGLRAHQVHVSVVSQDHEIGEAVVTSGESSDHSGRRYVQVLDGRPSGVARVVATGATLHVPDAPSSDLVRQDLVVRWRAASMLYVPLCWGGDTRMVAILISETPHTFTAEEIALAETLASLAAGALALLESEDTRAATAERDGALTRAARALNASLDLQEVLETLSREAGLTVEGSLAGVYLADGSGGGVATAGHNTPPDWLGIVLRRGEGIAGRVLDTGRPYITNSYQTDVEVPAHPALRGFKTAVGVPMVWDGELKGALSVGFVAMRRVTDSDLRTLEAIAELAVVACRNAEAYEQARVAARTDALTGLLNHGALQLRMREEIARAAREGSTLSCLLIDLDDFKAVNDDQGHLAGDELLRQVARALQVELREYDQIARYGGDEFVVLLPGCDAAGGRAVAQRVRTAVSGTVGHLIAECSIGVAQWGEPLAADELLERADRALGLAKRTGKQRVAVAGADLDAELELLQAPEGSPAAIMREFWEMVAGCESGRDALLSLPSFLRRAVAAEEVALYELAPDETTLNLEVRDREADDPQPLTFPRERLRAGAALGARLGLGALSRPSLDGLLAALAIETASEDRAAPAGAYAAVPLLRVDRVHGLLAIRTRRGVPPERLRLAELLARQTMAIVGAQPTAGSPAAVQALASAIEARDNYTHEHSEQVVALATDVARLLGLPAVEEERVRHGAALHDVGKLATPNEILHKPGPLTDTEWTIMAEHPVIGERILRRTPQLAHLAPIVRHEHERWDGGGYPDGLAGTRIPIASRIILACDAYNAMITTRPYREAMSPADAIAELRAKAGTQFDPTVVAALLRRLESVQPAAGAGDVMSVAL